MKISKLYLYVVILVSVSKIFSNGFFQNMKRGVKNLSFFRKYNNYQKQKFLNKLREVNKSKPTDVQKFLREKKPKFMDQLKIKRHSDEILQEAERLMGEKDSAGKRKKPIFRLDKWGMPNLWYKGYQNKLEDINNNKNIRTHPVERAINATYFNNFIKINQLQDIDKSIYAPINDLPFDIAKKYIYKMKNNNGGKAHKVLAEDVSGEKIETLKNQTNPRDFLNNYKDNIKFFFNREKFLKMYNTFKDLTADNMLLKDNKFHVLDSDLLLGSKHFNDRVSQEILKPYGHPKIDLEKVREYFEKELKAGRV